MATAMAVFVVGNATSQPAVAEEEGRALEGRVLVGTTLAVVFHELGHALIHELDIPAVGQEEDVVDNFAVLWLNTYGAQPQTPFWKSIVRYSSLVWYHNSAKPVLDDRGSEWLSPPSWFGEHAPTMRRFNNALCLN